MAKMRIHEFAKELDIPGKDVITILEKLGENGKTVSSSIDEELQEKMHITYLFVSHDLSMVSHISHRVGVMYLGHMVEMADMKELYTHHQHPYTKALMSAVPIADPDIAAKTQRIVLQGGEGDVARRDRGEGGRDPLAGDVFALLHVRGALAVGCGVGAVLRERGGGIEQV